MVHPEIEQELFAVQLAHPRGNYNIWKENDKKWRAVLNRFLVDEKTMFSINGSFWRYSCSDNCLEEVDEEEEKDDKYQFLDTARFALKNCVHASPHLQCIVSYFIANQGYTTCSIRDTPQCKYDNGRRGEAFFWAPEDYYSFARAFFRTRALTEAFLKPQFREVNHQEGNSHAEEAS